jgi:thiamine-monophosphate kinase
LLGLSTIADLSEAALIARIRERLAPPPPWLAVGIGDDAAVVEPERNRLEVFSVDAIVEGIHFDRRFSPPDAIGHRALAVNLSDLAAMGAAPRLALLSMALPVDMLVDDFDRVVSGFTLLAARSGLHVVGGNLTRSPGPLVIDVTVVGTVKRRQTLTRAGARPGDAVYVTGSIGAAAAGLQMVQMPGHSAAALTPCVRKYLYPEARVRVGLMLARNRAASACMDLSDGLADGVRQIAEASEIGVVVEAGALPIDPEARAWFASRGVTDDDIVMKAVTGGDDYELVFTVRPKSHGRLKAASGQKEVPLTRIGVCTEARGVLLRRTTERGAVDVPLPRGFSHFH